MAKPFTVFDAIDPILVEAGPSGKDHVQRSGRPETGCFLSVVVACCLKKETRSATKGGIMIVTAVTVYVKQEHIQDFIQATILNHEGSVREAGNMRFDLLQCAEDPSRFMLYEAYESIDAARAHKETDHYKVWKETVAPWMARPREGVAHEVVAPRDRAQW
jgi:autoinducer 2-degrading protein